jgi:hypothetical protein
MLSLSMMNASLSRLKRIACRVVGLPSGIGSHPSIHETDHAELVDFICNICGQENRRVPLLYVENREYQSCRHCHSSLRMRSLMYVLSLELFGKALCLPEFPLDKTLTGLGMSDWVGYASGLERKFSYTNTFYHVEPRLDISMIDGQFTAKHRFLISSDVFEHIPLYALESSFMNCRRLLRDNGVFIFTVPFKKHGATEEHFPNLHDFRIVETNGKRFLLNTTTAGTVEIFDNLVFHGGEGMTLEMRMFSESDLRSHLERAGFGSVKIYADHVPEFGILWPMDWAVPIAATPQMA